MPRQSRSSSRPTPGQLLGKVENRRCRVLPSSSVWSSRWVSTPSKGLVGVPLLRDLVQLQIDDSALQSYRDSMGPVVSAKLGEDVPDVARSEERRVGKECRSRWSPYH